MREHKVDQKGLLLTKRYQLRNVLHRGGTALVYDAYDQVLKRRCAIKIIATPLTPQEDTRTRLCIEAETLLRVQHPNIVRCLDLGETADGSPYLVMEFLAGEDLSGLLRRSKRLTWAQALPLIEQLVDALHFLHGRGIVHRDIKPANIFICYGAGPALTERLQVKLIDFGIVLARSVHRICVPPTCQGLVLGSASYVSPEAAIGISELVDEKTDLWALALVVHQILTGSLPLGRYLPAFRQRCLEVRSALLPEDVPVQVASALVQALHPDPEQRFKSAREFLATLKGERALVSAPVVPPRKLGAASGLAELSPSGAGTAQVPPAEPQGRLAAVASALSLRRGPSHALLLTLLCNLALIILLCRWLGSWFPRGQLWE